VERGTPKVARSGENRGKLRKIVQYFAIERSANRWEPTKIRQKLGLKGTESGKVKPPCPL